MIFNLSKDNSQTSSFEPGEAEVRELSLKVQKQINDANKQESSFKREREQKASQPRLRFTVDDFNKFIETLENPQCSALELTPVFARTNPSDKYSENLKIMEENYPYYMEGFDIASELSDKEEIMFIKALLKIFSIPRRVIRNLIKLPKERRSVLLYILKTCLLCLCFYLIIIVVSPIVISLLNRAFFALKNQLSMGIDKLKKQLNDDQKKEDQIEESKEFWDKYLGSLSQVIKISRGGSFVSIREANIYEFSELDQEQALLFASPITAYIQLESSKWELEKFIDESQQTLSRRKRIKLKVKEFYSKLKRFPSKLKEMSFKVIIIIMAITILINAANNGIRVSPQLQNFYTYETGSQIEKVAPSIIPRVAPYIKETSQNMNSSLIEMKDSFTSPSAPSPVKSRKRVRKKAKITGLSDLPPLSQQDSDFEIDSPLMVRPSSLKVRY